VTKAKSRQAYLVTRMGRSGSGTAKTHGAAFCGSRPRSGRSFLASSVTGRPVCGDELSRSGTGRLMFAVSVALATETANISVVVMIVDLAYRCRPVIIP
jgi:hypothetical protein